MTIYGIASGIRKPKLFMQLLTEQHEKNMREIRQAETKD